MNDDVPRLIDAYSEAFDQFFQPSPPFDAAGHPIPSQTFCNEAVQYVLARFNYTKMAGMNANQMVDFMRRSSDWQAIGMDQAQDLANAGRIIVAGAENLIPVPPATEPHGHVVIIRPGRPEYSAKWQTNAPKCSNVGLRPFGKMGQSVAYAFHEIPEFWLLNVSQGG